jgi:hypothetical protein
MANALRTVGEVSRETGIPGWQVRELVDKLRPSVQRAGLYRLIDDDLLEAIKDCAGRKQVAGRATE